MRHFTRKLESVSDILWATVGSPLARFFIRTNKIIIPGLWVVASVMYFIEKNLYAFNNGFIWPFSYFIWHGIFFWGFDVFQHLYCFFSQKIFVVFWKIFNWWQGFWLIVLVKVIICNASWNIPKFLCRKRVFRKITKGLGCML